MWLINLMRNEETGAVKDFPSKYCNYAQSLLLHVARNNSNQTCVFRECDGIEI